MSPKLWIVVPAYCEAAVLGVTLSDLLAYLPQIVVVDDGSSDATARCAAEAGAYVLRHPINLGQGAALQTGIDFALSRGAELVCTFDADGQHDASAIPQLLAEQRRSGADVVLASRFLGSAPAMPPLRRLVLRVAVAITRLQTGLALTDTHNGLRLFTRDAAARIHLRQAGMAHGSEILAIVSREKMRVSEIATTIRYTAYSRAKGQRLSNSVKIAVDLIYSAFSS